MEIQQLRDRDRIERFLRRESELHLYEIGDLDDFFWPRTRWFGGYENGRLCELLLVYDGPHLPTLLAHTRRPRGPMRELLRGVMPLLPERLYAHLSVGLAGALPEAWIAHRAGRHLRLILRDAGPMRAVEIESVEFLDASHLQELEAFYATAYPGNWFDGRMLATGHYVGARSAGHLVSVAGVHVFSAEHRIAALGNVATLAEHRGRGWATRTVAALCRRLAEQADVIGANVKADNVAALRCYERLGFQPVADYEEYGIDRRKGRTGAATQVNAIQ